MQTQTIVLPIFGKIELKNIDSEYEALIYAYDCEDVIIDLDVHFKELDPININSVSKVLEELNLVIKIGAKIIFTNFFNDGVAKKYIEEWNEDIFEQIFSQKEFDAFVFNTDKNKSIEERLLSLIRLVRVGIYTESDNSFIILDYAFGYDIDKGFRDDMLVIKLNIDYKFLEITTEG